MNNERATPNYEFMTDSSQEIKFPLKNVWKSDKSWEPEKIWKFKKIWKFEKIFEKIWKFEI